MDDLRARDFVVGKSRLAVKNCQYRHPRFNSTVNLNFVTGDAETAFHDLFLASDSQRELSIFFPEHQPWFESHLHETVTSWLLMTVLPAEIWSRSLPSVHFVYNEPCP